MWMLLWILKRSNINAEFHIYFFRYDFIIAGIIIIFQKLLITLLNLIIHINYDCKYIFSIKRTRVIDDENDYFTTTGNKWLNEEEKKLLQKKGDEQRARRFASRLGPCKVTFDFANKRIFEVEPENYDATEDSAVMAANFGTGGRNEKNIDEEVPRTGFESLDLKAEVGLLNMVLDVEWLLSLIVIGDRHCCVSLMVWLALTISSSSQCHIIYFLINISMIGGTFHF